MTREEVKEKLIMEFAESETMQIKNKDKWADVENPDFCCSPDKYRIKPETKYRPFKTQEECWQEMQKHQPFGWVMRVEIGGFVHITSVQSTKKQVTD